MLRDGAAAQYGSDAIAGVLDFLPRDTPRGGQIGACRAGDGAAYNLAGNFWGDPAVDDDLKLFGNFGRRYAGGRTTRRGKLMLPAGWTRGQLLQAFLQRVANSGGRIEREYGWGGGAPTC